MVQPVHTENNNSALDMESLEEMLRKVTTFQQLSATVFAPAALDAAFEEALTRAIVRQIRKIPRRRWKQIY